MIKHAIKHYYQPTNYSCGQAAVAMLLSFFGKSITPEEVMSQVAGNKSDQGQELGTLNQDLASWCLSLGYSVDMYSADFQLLDISWADLSTDELVARLEVVRDNRVIPTLGEQWSRAYAQSYIDFLTKGGNLTVVPYMTQSLLDDLLTRGPVVLCVCYNVLYGTGRVKAVAVGHVDADDIQGDLINHTVVLYGKDSAGDYLIADPFEKPGRVKASPECLLAAMAAAQIECDNVVFRLEKNHD